MNSLYLQGELLRQIFQSQNLLMNQNFKRITIRYSKILTVVCLVLDFIYTIFHYVNYWRLMLNSFKNLDDVFSYIRAIDSCFRVICDIIFAIGLVVLLMRRKLEINFFLKFYLFIFWCSLLCHIYVDWFSTSSNFWSLSFNELPIHFYLYKILSNILILSSGIYFYITSNLQEGINAAVKPVSKWSRLINRLIDLFIISIFLIPKLSILDNGSIYEDIPFLSENPFWIFTLFGILYYFIFESIFLQTIGKLHNNSYVSHSGPRIPSISLRSICRLIPFDSFSYLGRHGWHDSISNTNVIVHEVQARDDLPSVTKLSS